MSKRKRGVSRIGAWSTSCLDLKDMSAVQVMAQSGVGGAADRTPFFGIKIPLEVKKTVQLSKTLDMGLFKKIVKCGVPSSRDVMQSTIHLHQCRCN